MIKGRDIELKYFQTIGQDDQWFVLNEFSVTNTELFCGSDPEILTSLLSTRIFNENLYHEEMNGIELELKRLHLGSSRPYKFDKIKSTDLKFLITKTAYEEWLQKFRSDGWEDDREDAQILINKSENELWSRTKLKTGVWHLSKGNFENDMEKLTDNHWIYAHFETFVEIDRENKLIRTFDFGYD